MSSEGNLLGKCVKPKGNGENEGKKGILTKKWWDNGDISTYVVGDEMK